VVDIIITELGVFCVENGHLYLQELAPHITLDEIKAKTEANFTVRLVS
jgi:acyl CoA:acetate/3-ketoacid CoA transferase beta subunit